MALAIIQLKTLVAGPDGVLQPGVPVGVEAAFARELVALGYAEMLQDVPLAPPVAKKIERAVVAPPEDAAAGPSAKKR